MSPRKKPVVIATNPRYARLKLPRPRGEFSTGQPTVEPVTKVPRARLGEPFKGASVTVTGKKATTTIKARGGSA